MSQKPSPFEPKASTSVLSNKNTSPSSKHAQLQSAGGVRSSSSSSSGANTRISNSYTSELKPSSKTRSDSGRDSGFHDTTISETTQFISSTSPRTSEKSALSTAIGFISLAPNETKNDDATINPDEVTKKEKKKKEKGPRKISNDETKSTQCEPIQPLKRANSYASSCKPIDSNVIDCKDLSSDTLTIKQASSDLPNSQGQKSSDLANTGIEALAATRWLNNAKNKTLQNKEDKESVSVIKDEKLSRITRKTSSFHAGVKSNTLNTSSTTSNQKTESERRSSCYAGSLKDLSTADLFSEHRDSSGFPRLQWKEDPSVLDHDGEGKD